MQRGIRSILVLTMALSALAASGAALAQPAPKPAASKLTKPPKLVTFVEAPYPPSERAAGRAASVVLQLTLGADGKVTEVKVTESAGPAFDAAAAEAARAFVFEPAEVDGKPSPIRILYKYDFVLKQEKPTTASLEGVVRDRAGKPMAGVKVSIEGAGEAVTDDAGAFRIDGVAPGERAVTLSGSALTPVRTTERFEAGKRATALYEIEPPPKDTPPGEQDDLEIVVQAPPLRKEVVSTEISASEGRRLPGTQGDVLKVVESLPGVGRAAAGSGARVVWGAAPNDTRVYVNGVRVPRLYHEGGVRSVVHSDLVRSVELSPGAYGPGYGRGLGGLVTVALRPLDDERSHGSVSLDVLDASAAARVPLGSGFVAALALRRSHLDAAVRRVSSRDIDEVFPIPRYHDGQARLSWTPVPRTTVELGGLLSSDTVERTASSADPARFVRETRDGAFQRLYARFRRETDGGGVVDVVPWLGWDQTGEESRYGALPTTLRASVHTYALRAGYRGKLAPSVGVSVGFDGEVESSELSRVGSVTTPPREGDVRVFGQPPPDRVAGDAWSTLVASAAVFGELDVGLLEDRLHVVPGLRFEPYLMAASRRTPVEGDTPSIGLFSQETAVEPRVAVRYQVTPEIAARAGYGAMHQAPSASDLSAVFGNPTLGLSRARHYLAGASFRPTSRLLIETTVFHVRSSDLAVRSTASTPLLAEALVQEGEGRTLGAQFLVRRELGDGFFGWITYTIARSERIDHPGQRARLFDYDQTHVLTAVGSYDLGKGFEIGAKLRAASGFPRTPVLRAFFDSRIDAYQPVFGPQNSVRIPTFYAADVRAAKRFSLGWSELEVYLDVQNVTAHRNAEEIVYSSSYTRKRYITGLPILPLAGARWSW